MRSLKDTLKIEVNALQSDKINYIDRFDFAPVAKKLKSDMVKAGVPVTDDFIEEGILALKQYYAVALLDPLNMHAVSDKVDPFWHTHMFFSRDYAEFCDELIGAFMHHQPLDHDNIAEVKNVARLYDYTLACYSKFYNYVNSDLTPKKVEDERLICVHFGNSYAPEIHAAALMPINRAMQPEAVFVK